VSRSRTFLRWAGVERCCRSWDNYFATPANYYLYNAGRAQPPQAAAARRPRDAEPYFAFIPWDYDNSFGIDYFAPSGIHRPVDWPANTEPTTIQPPQRSVEDSP